MRDRLVGLIGCALREYAEYSAEMFNAGNYGIESMEEYVADYLLKNVIVAPMPMTERLRQELTEYVHQRCVDEL